MSKPVKALERRPQSRHRHGQRPPRPGKPGTPPSGTPGKVKRPEDDKKEERNEEEKKSNGGKIAIIIIVVLMLLGGGGYLAYTVLNKPKKVEKVKVIVKEEEPVIKKQMKAIDMTKLKMVQVEKGNYLYALSKQLYGDPKYWTLIYKANFTKLDNPDFLPKMVELMVYEIDSSATSLTVEDSTMMSEAYTTVAKAYKKHGNDTQSAAYTERAMEFVPSGIE